MKGTHFTLTAIVVIAVAVIDQAQGFPKPQIQDSRELTDADGFAFDGRADRTIPTNPTMRPRDFRPSSTEGTFFPSQRPLISTRPPPVVVPTVGLSTQRPDAALCAANCPITPEYNPVCGSDGVMYNNAGHLACARNCGIVVVQRNIGRCTSVVRG